VLFPPYSTVSVGSSRRLPRASCTYTRTVRGSGRRSSFSRAAARRATSAALTFAASEGAPSDPLAAPRSADCEWFDSSSAEPSDEPELEREPAALCDWFLLLLPPAGRPRGRGAASSLEAPEAELPEDAPGVVPCVCARGALLAAVAPPAALLLSLRPRADLAGALSGRVYPGWNGLWAWSCAWNGRLRLRRRRGAPSPSLPCPSASSMSSSSGALGGGEGGVSQSGSGVRVTRRPRPFCACEFVGERKPPTAVARPAPISRGNVDRDLEEERSKKSSPFAKKGNAAKQGNTSASPNARDVIRIWKSATTPARQTVRTGGVEGVDGGRCCERRRGP
jgi:hypothetical protein